MKVKKNSNTKYFLSLIVFAFCLIAAFFLFRKSLAQVSFNGLPTVPCIDPTLKITNYYSFKLRITISGKDNPLEGKIGYDPANCQRSIYTDDNSGNVFVRSNIDKTYTLGDFFNVWHKSFNKNQFYDHLAIGGKTISVKVNGSVVNTYEKTALHPKDEIEVIYN